MHDLLNKKFGSLLVIEKSGYNKHRADMWKCECDCGKIKIIQGASLRRGTTKSCGCKSSESRRKDITGIRSGKLTAIKFLHVNKERCCVWLCKCDCGNFAEVRSTHIRRKTTKSCGCGHVVKKGNQLKRKYANKELSTIMSIYNGYKKRASKRGFDFELDVSTFTKLIYGNCYYCDSKPKTKRNTTGGCEIITNGIDRVNNAAGYTKNNVVACCFECNDLKSNNNLNELLEKQARISSIIQKLM